MKLRNKETGEIVDFKKGNLVVDGNRSVRYDSLAELNEEWEDYEEPKKFWYIGQDGVIFSDVDTITKDYADRLESIGNKFETEEEAEKAVEKLKAWKRLKDKGFRFDGWYGGSRTINFEIADYKELLLPEKICDDLKLLFGGEE